MHSKSQIPLSKEYRLFYFQKQFLFQFDYWKITFFTMDIGKTDSGDWIIIEIGEGQVSGLSIDSDILGFYKSIKERTR